MFKKYLLGLLLLSFTAVCSAQSLSVNAVDNTARNGTSIFNLEQGKISFQGGGIQFITGNTSISNYIDYGVSEDLSILAYIKGNNENSKVTVTNSLGQPLNEFDITDLSPGDPSIAVYPANTGEVLVRDNIAAFNFYNSFGELIRTLSSSSQSEGGEAISEAVISPTGETAVLYTPKIKRDGKLGSQVQYVDRSMNLQSLFFSTERYIKTLHVSADGQFIIFVTAKEGTDDRIHLSDRYGNDLSILSTDENLQGAILSDDAGVVTAYSSRRVLVFDAFSGKRIAGTSFRSDVIAVDYFPQDNTILAMTGSFNEDTGVADNLEFHAIDIERRKVERKDYDSSIGFSKAIGHRFVRLGSYRYKLVGTSKHLELRVRF